MASSISCTRRCISIAGPTTIAAPASSSSSATSSAGGSTSRSRPSIGRGACERGPRRRAAPAAHTKGRPHLRVLGTEITLLEGVRRQAEKDLGISIGFELLDFLGTQQKAARQPAAFDIYDQCFHNLDIVWFWRGVQPMDPRRTPHWEEVSDLTRRGRLNPDASIGHGDAPVNRLYVQPD